MSIVIFGKTGQVGWELQRALAPLGPVHACDRAQADLSQPEMVATVVRRLRPRVVVNAAAYTAVDRAEDEEFLAFRINCDAVAALAAAAAAVGAWVIHYSTDYVYDGGKGAPYREDDATNPLSAYGRSKLAGEHALRAATSRHLILRTSWVFGRHGSNFAKTILRLAGERAELRVVADQVGAPTSAELIADVTAQVIARLRIDGDDADRLAGIYHLAAAGQTSWHGYARWLVEQASSLGAPLTVAPQAVHAIAAADYPAKARRPADSRLDCGKLGGVFGLCLPDWRLHAARLVEQMLAR